MNDKANYDKPTSQVDLEARQQEDYVPPTQLQPGVDPSPSDTGYVGVDPIYQNFANETEKPYAAEGGPEAVVEETVYADNANFNAGRTSPGLTEDVDYEDDEDDEEAEPESPSASGSGSGSTSPKRDTSPSTTTPPAPSSPSSSS